MDGETKILGACYRKTGQLYKVRVVTINPNLVDEWKKLHGQPIFNGWQKKVWKKGIVIGHIYFDRWGVEPNMSVSPECPCLEVCLFAGPLAKKLFGIKTEELRFSDNNFCLSCKIKKARKEKN